MRIPWLLTSPLFEEDSGNSSAGVITLGDVVEHDNTPAPAREKPQESNADKELKQLRADLADTKRRLSETEADSRHWANEARRRPVETKPAVVEEEPDDTVVDETADAFLDDVSKEGLSALKKRGVVTREDLKAVVKEVMTEVDGKISSTVQGAKLDQKMVEEFPELTKEAKEIEKAAASGSRHTPSALYRRTAEIFRESVAEDPGLKNSPAAMLIAARQARAELKGNPAEKEANVETRATRRSRIEQARPARESAPGGDDTDAPDYSDDQLTVMQKLGVSEKEFEAGRKQAEKGKGRRG